MPHFVIDCSEKVLTLDAASDILARVHQAASDTGLFDPGDIKVRIRSFHDFTVGNTRTDFIHVFGNIMEGRSTAQKAALSRAIVTQLTSMFPTVPVISINIREFDKATYINRQMI